jgi:hypothetical protein
MLVGGVGVGPEKVGVCVGVVDGVGVGVGVGVTDVLGVLVGYGVLV